MAGKELVKPAKVAPIPKETKRAGRAQQISVPADVNKLKLEGNKCLRLKLLCIINLININVSNCITSVSHKLCHGLVI